MKSKNSSSNQLNPKHFTVRLGINLLLHHTQPSPLPSITATPIQMFIYTPVLKCSLRRTVFTLNTALAHIHIYPRSRPPSLDRPTNLYTTNKPVRKQRSKGISISKRNQVKTFIVSPEIECFARSRCLLFGGLIRETKVSSHDLTKRVDERVD